MYGKSSYLRSAKDNARKYVGVPNGFAIAITSHKKPFPECWCSLTRLTKKVLLLATNLSIFLCNFVWLSLL